MVMIRPGYTYDKSTKILGCDHSQFEIHINVESRKRKTRRTEKKISNHVYM